MAQYITLGFNLHRLYCKMMMGMMQWPFIFLSLFSSTQMSIVQSKCNHQIELSALIQFKDSFQINCTNGFGDDFGYPKTTSWNNNGTAEWNGVECDPVTGHVIGLDLSSSCLQGSINSNSSSIIFNHLVHLEHLNLAYNDFQGSSIPSKLGNFSRLRYLNLSTSWFRGQVPLEISKLFMLNSLDLSYNWDIEVNLKRLVKNLTTLEELNLTSTSINSEVPKWLFKNTSSLRSLKLNNCGLKGEFPQGIFYFPKLQHLDIQWNWDLEGHLPTEFNSSTTPLLESLLVGITNFSGTIPDSIGNLVLLKELDLTDCKFSGSIPASLGNLTHLISLDLSYYFFGQTDLSYFNTFFPIINNFTTLSSWLGKLNNLRNLEIAGANLIGYIPPYSLANLTHLSSVDLSGNRLSGEIPPASLVILTNLSYLDLSGNRLTGQIPSVLTNLTQLSSLRLSDNQLTGEIPHGLFNLTKLTYLDVSNNTLHGPLPIQDLRNIEYLYVSDNQLSGTLEVGMFLEFSNLTHLLLSSNNLTLLQEQTNVSTNSTLPRLEVLGLSSCHLSKFPELLMHLPVLITLNLSYNNIDGPIPQWMGSIKSLRYIDMSHNLITSLFDDPHLSLRWPYLQFLDISYNKLQGSVPIPSQSIQTYRASNNELTGEMPRSFCNLTSLQVLDFSSNRLTGELDPYYFSKSDLTALNLRNNSFNGKIPEFCTNETNYFILAMIDLNSNQFQGKIPRSLANCVMLEFFDLGNNFINDTFPSWLVSLSSLKVLILKDNALHGSIGTMPNMSGYWFPELTIIDLSHNSLSGNLTSWHFEQWMAMKIAKLINPSYMGQDLGGYMLFGFYDYSLTMNNKGIDREYPKILDALVAIDLSSNELEGEIPTTIGDLLGLRSLNLSNNHLSGGIPSSLGVITHLESLDLSSNRLSGHLPQQLTGLNFLSVFDVSRNNLTGLIPQGPQFNTFSNMSYLENPRLCGEPLSRKCEISDAQPPDEMAEKEGKFWEGGVLWMVVATGFGGGLVVGVAVENMADWRMLIIIFWRRMKNWRNRRG